MTKKLQRPKKERRLLRFVRNYKKVKTDIATVVSLPRNDKDRIILIDSLTMTKEKSKNEIATAI